MSEGGDLKAGAERALSHFSEELAKIHTGRPNPGLIENVIVNYNGSDLALKQIASITVSGTNQLTVAPWDRNQETLSAIEKAITSSSTGFGASSAGDAVRVSVPPLSEERRHEYVKLVEERLEGARVTVRQARQDAISRLRRRAETEKLSKDEVRRTEEGLTQETNQFIRQAEELAEKKRSELTLS